MPLDTVRQTFILPQQTVAPTEDVSVVAFESVADNLVAWPSGPNPGTLLTKRWNRFITVANAGDSASLLPARAGMSVTVRNDAATNAMNIFPASGEAVNGAGVNTPFSLAAGTQTTFRSFTNGAWWTS